MSTLVPGSRPSASRRALGNTIRPAWSMTASMGIRYHRIPISKLLARAVAPARPGAYPGLVLGGEQSHAGPSLLIGRARAVLGLARRLVSPLIPWWSWR